MAEKKTMESRQAGVGLWELYFVGGGVLPKDLTTKFSSKRLADEAKANFFQGRRNTAKVVKPRKKVKADG